jgi:hypothetical protein
MNQNYNYTLPNGVITTCNTYVDHYYLLLKLGQSFSISEKISFHPRLGIGAAVLYQQEGLTPSLTNSYYDDWYSSYIKMKQCTPMAEIETSFFYQFNKYLLAGLSPYVNGNVFTYTSSSDSPYHLFRKNYGLRILLGWQLI